MNELRFSFGGTLCIDSMGVEVEIGPRNYRAFCEVDRHGTARIARVELNDARLGNPDYWILAPLPFEVLGEIRKALVKEFQREQLRLVEQYDEEIA